MADAKNRPFRIGEILVEQGVLSEQQVFEVTQVQKQRGVPFGVLAEQMFDVTSESIERAWIEQYHRFTGTLDLESVEIDEDALKLLQRRQAWQFEILPIRFEETGELLLTASKRRFARAVTFVANQIEPVVYFRLVESEQLRTFLQRHYPMPEISQALIERARAMASEPSSDAA